MNKHFKIIIFITILTITFLTIGYSVNNISLNLTDISAKMRLKKDIRITSFSVDSITNNAVSNYEEYNINSISSMINLPYSDSTITFKIDITNIESAEMGLLAITGLNDELDYTILNYNLKDKICNNDLCNLGITKDIYITIKYKENTYNSDNTIFNLNLEFDFRQAFNITYTGITNVNDYPSYILQGETLNITFNNVTSATIQETTNYTFDNGILIVNDISTNLTIELTSAYEGTDFVVQGNGDNIIISAPDISTDNPINVTDILQKTFEGVNTTNKVITKIEVTTTYSTTTGSNQNINCILIIGQNRYTQQISFQGKQTNGKVVAIFDNLNITPNTEFEIIYEQIKITNGNINISNKEVIFYLSDAS